MYQYQQNEQIMLTLIRSTQKHMALEVRAQKCGSVEPVNEIIDNNWIFDINTFCKYIVSKQKDKNYLHRFASIQKYHKHE